MEDDGVELLLRLAGALDAGAWAAPPRKLRSDSASALAKYSDDAPISPGACSAVLAALCPDGFCLSNEGGTMGGRVMSGVADYVHYDDLELVGGAIGQGLPARPEPFSRPALCGAHS